jgi:hypothetical protein
LDQEIFLSKGKVFYLVLEFEQGGHAYDASFEMDVALHSGKLPPWGDPVDVNSKALEGEGHFLHDGQWKDFSEFVSKYNKQKDHPHASKNATASPAIHAYTSIITKPID